MNFNELAKEIHANAVAHGWWDEERTLDECLTLMDSEVSEAVEEYRKGRPLVYYHCEQRELNYRIVLCSSDLDCFSKDCVGRSKKPEGVAVEMIDCLIRILDWCGREGLELSRLDFAGSCDNFMQLARAVHNNLALISTGHHSPLGSLSGAATEIILWCEANGVDWQAVLLEKHEYNKTRPYRHGGKII